MTREQPLCTFYLDGDFFGIEVSRVQEILRYRPITEVPLSDPVIRGLINLRGQIITAIDLRRRLGLPGFTEGDRPTNVVIRRGEDHVSLLVDRIGDVIRPPADLFETPPENVASHVRALVTGVFKLDHRLLLVLDVDKILEFESEQVA